MAEKESLSEMQEFYRGKTIFITGGSGFMGKVLVEKLLYSCSELEKIYILLRPKRGQDIGERMESMLKLPVFQRIRDEKPEMLKKLIPIPGDVTVDNLGLDEASQELLVKNTNIVFHFAATVKLEAVLRDAVEMNLTGTHRMLCLAKQMKKLDVFLHLSTAFCYCDKDILYEEVSEATHKPHDIMNMVKFLDDKTLDAMTPSLLAPHPNTYTYAKRLAEVLVHEERHNLPCVIARPSIVTPSAFEPVPGWVDNLNGPVGLMVAAGKGVVRSMLCNPEHNALIVPVDYAINAVLSIAYAVATDPEKKKTLQVYNMTCDDRKQKTWGTVLLLAKKYGVEYPLNAGIWYPNGDITTSPLLHFIRVMLFQWVPAYFLDFLLLCFGQKRFMVHVQNKIALGMDILKYFTTHKWNFKTTNVISLLSITSPRDQEIFYMDPGRVDEEEYMKTCILGARQYCMKEPLSTMPRARRHLKILYVLDKLSSILFVLLCIWMFLKVTGLFSLLETSTGFVRTHPPISAAN